MSFQSRDIPFGFPSTPKARVIYTTALIQNLIWAFKVTLRTTLRQQEPHQETVNNTNENVQQLSVICVGSVGRQMVSCPYCRLTLRSALSLL